MSYRYVTRKDVYYTLEYWLKQILGSKKFFKKEILSNISHYLETTIGSWNVLISIPGMKKIESQDLYKYLDKYIDYTSGCSAGGLLTSLGHTYTEPKEISDKYISSEGRWGYVYKTYLDGNKYVCTIGIIKPDNTIVTFVVHARQNLGTVTCHKSDGSTEKFHLTTARDGSKLQESLNLDTATPMAPRIHSVYPGRDIRNYT